MIKKHAVILALLVFAGCKTTSNYNAYMKSAGKRLSEPILASSSEEKQETQRRIDHELKSSGSRYSSPVVDAAKATKNAKLMGTLKNTFSAFGDIKRFSH